MDRVFAWAIHPQLVLLALDEPGTALVVIEVLGHTLAVLCFGAHLGCTALEGDRTELSVALGVVFGQSGARVCVHV